MSLIKELTSFWGFKLNKPVKESIFHNSNVLKISSFGMDGKSHARTPMSTSVKLISDMARNSINQTMYRSMIGSLLYLTASRPDIAFSVRVCARFQANPRESHLIAVKRILRYVNAIANFGVYFSRDTNLALAGYSDADWVGNADDRKSTSRECFYVETNMVAWMSKKQNSISPSTVEARYIATGSCCTQLIWMKQLLVDYGFP